MLTPNFHPFPQIHTERLLLRQVVPGDANEILALRSDPELMRFIPRPLATSVEDALLHIENMNAGLPGNDAISWAITFRGQPRLIGCISCFNVKKEHYRAEIGYMLHNDYHGKGILKEALEAVVAYGFNTMKLHSIEAVIDPENLASARLLEKSGFVREAYFRENEFYMGKFLDSLVYSRLNKPAN